MGWLPYFSVFVIPTGATSGQRIVIDGINGQIVMYDASNNPVIVESSQAGTLQFNGAAASFSMMLGLVTDPFTLQPTPGFSFHSTAPPSVKDGVVTMGQAGGSGYIAFVPPLMSGDPVGVDITNVTMTYAQGDGGSDVQAEWFSGSGNLAGTTAFAAAPATWLTDGAFHLFTNAQWPSYDIVVPPTGGLEISVYMTGHNASTSGFTMAAAFQITRKSTGAVLMAPSLSYAAFVIAPSAGYASNGQAVSGPLSIGQDILANFVGETVTITPAYRATNASGSANVGYGQAKITVRPSVYAAGFTP